MAGQLLRQPDRRHGRSACLSVCHATLSVQNLSFIHTAVLQLPQERPHMAQGEDGLQPDLRAPANVY